jgi:hypothetical protein
MRQWIYWLLGLALALTQLAGCQKQAPFKPALAGHFFPLRAGLTWMYQVTYADGARQRIADRVVSADQPDTSRSGVLVMSDYSGVDGSLAIRADVRESAQMIEVQTWYVLENGYITRSESLGELSRIRLEEHGFLPQYLWPGGAWSNTLSPFEHLSEDFLTVKQNHRTFLEEHNIVVPAGTFADCIRIETEASYSYRSRAGSDNKRFFTDWYAPNVGLVKTLVLTSGPNGREIARIELLRFGQSKNAPPGRLSNRPQ